VADQTIVIWGAGRIGRGFVADLFHDAGYRIVFVDKSAALAEQLRNAGQYTVVRAPSADRQEQVRIAGYTALATTEVERVAAAVAKADLMAVAVYPDQFEAVASAMTRGLLRRQAERPDVPLDILICTNLMHPGPRFQRALEQSLPSQAQSYLRARIGIVETVVFRIAPDGPPAPREHAQLSVWTNGYPELPTDGHAFKGPLPDVAALRFVDDMRAEETRKIYTYNMAHAVLAYQGARRKHDSIVSCLADPQVRCEAQGALQESSRALQAEYGFPAEQMAQWQERVLADTNNPVLADTVQRCAADTRRKLQREDRLVGPALLALKHGIQPIRIIEAIAAALHYVDADDAGAQYVQDMISSRGLRDAIRELCGLTDADTDLMVAIAKAYDRQELEAKWAAMAQRAYELGFEYERHYHGCGQCALAAVLEATDMFDEAVFEAATPAAGGLGHCGDATCSALTGVSLAIGLAFPRRRANFGGDRENKYRTFSMVQQLIERYEQRYGGIRCHDIHRHEFGRAYDLRLEAEREAFDAAGAHEDKCTSVVARAAKWAVEIIGAERMAEAAQSQCEDGHHDEASTVEGSA
jgi:mannitol-1-phosphate 5-dehydrogenase